MKKTLLLLGLLATVAWARPIGNGDINQLKVEHESHPGYKKSAKSKQLPAVFQTMEYRQPRFKDWYLPYQSWEQEYRAYFLKYYGDNKLTFRPSMIVMHYTVTPTTESTYRALERNHVSVHVMIGHDGTVYRLLPFDRRCTGAYGVNHVALSIEMVAQTESDLLSRSRQVFSSFCTVTYLMAKYDIPLSKVVGHYEVGEGKKRVAEYTDLHDKIYPTSYPPSSARTDPGTTYMTWLRSYLKMRPPQPSDAE